MTDHHILFCVILAIILGKNYKASLYTGFPSLLSLPFPCVREILSVIITDNNKVLNFRYVILICSSCTRVFLGGNTLRKEGAVNCSENLL